MTSVPSEGEPVAKQECIRYEISDLHSISRSKTVPARHKGKSVYLPCGLVGLGPYCTAMANHGITLLPESVGDGYGNTLLEPDWSTLTTVPFASTDEYVTRRVICNQPGQPLPRQLCQEQLRKLDEAGYQFFSAHELEFTLLKPGPEAGDKIPDGGDVEAWVTAFKGIDYTSTIQTAKSEQFIMKVERDMDAMGVDIQTMNAEYGEGQMEITYGPKYGIEGPDASFTFKNGVKEIAMKSGLHATFMTKPLDDYGCNGGHTNFSLWTKDGKNAFYDEESGGKELSAIGKHWVAGVLKHGLAMQAIGAPTVSCYNR
jgi:glutamine synthetase